MKFERTLKAGLIIIAATTLITTSIYADNTSTIAQRLQPAGQVNLADATAATATSASATGDAALTKAKTIYDTKCVACHKDGIANAPKFGNSADWKTRLDATKETKLDKQLDVLLASAIKGKGAMPPRGTCASIKDDPANGCSDEDLKNTILYMVSGGKEPAKK